MCLVKIELWIERVKYKSVSLMVTGCVIDVLKIASFNDTSLETRRCYLFCKNVRVVVNVC